MQSPRVLNDLPHDPTPPPEIGSSLMAKVLTLHFGRGAEPDSHLQWLLDELPAALYITDAAGRLTYFNQAAATLWGYRPKLGETYWCGSWRLYYPDGTPLPLDSCPMAIALKERRVIRGME